MYLLEWLEGEKNHYVGIFESIESGRAFMQKVPGYRHKTMEEEGFIFEEEIIEYEELPDIAMIEYNGYRVPVSRFSFEADIMVIWVELDHLDAPICDKECSCTEKGDTNKIAAGATRIDAYSISNEDVEEYVTTRENQFRKCVELLEKEGFEISRECFGSEDGEVIFIRRKRAKRKQPEAGWRFLTHMDPLFVESDIEKELPMMLAELGKI